MLTDPELALNAKVVDVELKIAWDEPADSTPKPNAATNASAMRLNVVDLLVIYFLSEVVSETVSETADRGKTPIS